MSNTYTWTLSLTNALHRQQQPGRTNGNAKNKLYAVASASANPHAASTLAVTLQARCLTSNKMVYRWEAERPLSRHSPHNTRKLNSSKPKPNYYTNLTCILRFECRFHAHSPPHICFRQKCAGFIKKYTSKASFILSSTLLIELVKWKYSCIQASVKTLVKISPPIRFTILHQHHHLLLVATHYIRFFSLYTDHGVCRYYYNNIVTNKKNMQTKRNFYTLEGFECVRYIFEVKM